MASELVLIKWDDLELPHARVEASTTVSLGLDGRWVELDLTREHDDELREMLKPYLDAGRKPSNRQQAVPKTRRPQRRSYFRGLREWANASPEWGPQSYMTPSGKQYYSTKLKAAYDAYCATQGDPQDDSGEDGHGQEA